jgi:hypothetical protein
LYDIPLGLIILVQFVALKLTVVTPLQAENAQRPIFVTELGIVTDVSLEQP